jgi:hypothetical protein
LTAAAQRGGRELLEATRGLRVDLAFACGATATIYVAFLWRWGLWADQSIYHYMAWGVRHGLVLYRDTITMNWPGPVVIHVIGQWLTGMNGVGVRMVEAAMLWVLCAATAATLRAYRVPLPLRLAANVLFFAWYFEGGYIGTAQRESFMTPCLAVGLYPLLASAGGGGVRSPWAWLVAGVFAGFGFWIKPTCALVLAGAGLVTLVLSDLPRRTLVRRLFVYAGAFAAVFIAFVVFLAVYGDIHGFLKWGVRYTFGPYAHLRLGHADLLRNMVDQLSTDQARRVLGFCALGAAGFALSCWSYAMWIPIAGRAAAFECGQTVKRAVGAGTVVVLSLATVYAQGKGNGYHYVPVRWALPLLGATLLGGALPFPRSAWPLRLSRHGVAVVSVVAAMAFLGTYLEGWARADGGRVRDSFDDTVARSLKADETIIIFGFGTGLLCAVQRRTPLPFVDSWIVYAGMPEDSPLRREYVDIWKKAMADPSVRFFFVNRDLALSSAMRFVDWDDVRSQGVVANFFPEPALEALGFQRSKTVTKDNVDVYERVASPERPGVPQ